MKVDMDEDGVLIIKAESSVEAFALGAWCKQSMLRIESLQHAEEFMWRGSKLIVDQAFDRATWRPDEA